MKILAIETSCDDTSIAVAECQSAIFNLLSNVLSSQIEIHKKYGGVYPMMARREHQKNLVPVLEKTLDKLSIPNDQFSNKCQLSNSQIKKIEKTLERENILKTQLLDFLKRYKKPDIDIIAVTKGPGLEPCLWAGINFAKALSWAWQIPLIGINHIEGHLFSGFLKKESLKIKEIKKFLPAMALIVSGGHTQLILVKEINKYKIIGETRDDAAGEAFDKIARILELGYPGGPAIATAATKILNPKFQTLNKFKIQSSKFEIELPRPMFHSKDYDFSFSGLKTAVLYDFKKRKHHNKIYKALVAKEAQQAIIDVLLKKTLKATKDFRLKNIIIGGGVSANKELKKQFRQKAKKVKVKVPILDFATDNAAMIALAACLKDKKPDKITAEANLRL